MNNILRKVLETTYGFYEMLLLELVKSIVDSTIPITYNRLWVCSFVPVTKVVKPLVVKISCNNVSLKQYSLKYPSTVSDF